jgi:hypothetical protein
MGSSSRAALGVSVSVMALFATAVGSVSTEAETNDPYKQGRSVAREFSRNRALRALNIDESLASAQMHLDKHILAQRANMHKVSSQQTAPAYVAVGYSPQPAVVCGVSCQGHPAWVASAIGGNCASACEDAGFGPCDVDHLHTGEIQQMTTLDGFNNILRQLRNRYPDYPRQCTFTSTEYGTHLKVPNFAKTQAGLTWCALANGSKTSDKTSCTINAMPDAQRLCFCPAPLSPPSSPPPPPLPPPPSPPPPATCTGGGQESEPCTQVKICLRDAHIMERDAFGNHPDTVRRSPRICHSPTRVS